MTARSTVASRQIIVCDAHRCSTGVTGITVGPGVGDDYDPRLA